MYADHASTAYPTLFHGRCTPDESYANPAASHAPGRLARQKSEAALARIARRLRCPADASLIVTSGGTESNNLVIQQPGLWDFIVLMPTEHHAVTLPVQRMCNVVTPYRAGGGGVCEMVYLQPDGQGRLPLADLRAALATRAGAGRRGLVTVAYVNNEIGTVQDLEAIGAVVHAANPRDGGQDRRVFLHTDAVQAPGHVPDLAAVIASPTHGVDLLSLSAHKFHGPVGVGLLFCRTPALKRLLLHHPLLLGGHQQGGLRPGTESVSLLVAMADALDDALDPGRLSVRLPQLTEMNRLIWSVLLPFVVAGVVLPTGTPSSDTDGRAPYHISFCVRGADRRDLVAAMKRRRVYVSGGSACNTDTPLPSHVLAAIGVPAEFLDGSLRITLSHTNTVDEVRSVLCPALHDLLLQHSRRLLTASGRTPTSAPSDPGMRSVGRWG